MSSKSIGSVSFGTRFEFLQVVPGMCSKDDSRWDPRAKNRAETRAGAGNAPRARSRGRRLPWRPFQTAVTITRDLALASMRSTGPVEGRALWRAVGAGVPGAKMPVNTGCGRRPQRIAGGHRRAACGELFRARGARRVGSEGTRGPASPRPGVLKVCRWGQSSSRRERMMKRTPSGASSEKPLPRPGTTSTVRWVCFQYSNCEALM